ncbi:putative Retrotransposon protein [Penaeus vannamei]|uniref:RNA-directed DNA polymerase n=1 Tax=Penaeus vannamei TaxID=6689 RepID=A0A423TDY6_PENVA|nr:putative Retrotransposon protein [Penaeus vannamei]
MLLGSVPGPAAHPQPSLLHQSTQYGPHLQQAILVSQPHAHLHMAPPAAANCTTPYFQSEPAQPCSHACLRSTLASGRDEVPIFCGEMPASLGIQRNQELESWISSIELSTRPATSEAYIHIAQSRVSGYACSVLNSPVFTNIQDWVSFKARLSDQFCGVATAQHFYKMLGQVRMAVGQGLLDFFRAVELAVQQGVCDYPQDIGNAEGLMQRTSREGLPGWLWGQLLWHDFPSARKMIEKCQAVWDSVVGARHTLPDAHGLLRIGQSSSLWPSQPSTRNRMVLGLDHPGQYPDATTPGLEFYGDLLPQVALVGGTPASAVPDTGSQSARIPATTLPRRWSPHRMAGATTVVRRGTRDLCFPLAKAAWVECPSLRAAVLAHRELNNQPRTRFTGRLMIVLEVEGKPFSCFLDTGSEVTMVKREAVTCLPGVHLHASSRALQGVSGQPTPAVAEVDLALTIHRKLSHPLDLSLCQELRGACHDVADETPEAVETPELSQFPSPVAVSPVHVAEETVIEARSGKLVAATVTRSSPDDTRLAIVETCTDHLTVPCTLVTVQGCCSSVWVVDLHPKPWKIRPGTVLGYTSFLEPEEVVCTVPVSSMNSDTPDSKPPPEHLMATATPDLELEEFPEEDEFLDCGEFQDDDYHSTACLDFGYEDEDFFVFPDTAALDEACDVSPSEEKARPLEQAQEPHEDATEPLDLTRMMAVQMQEHQLQELACADLLGWLEGRQTVRRERPAAISSFEVEEGVLYYLRNFPDRVVRQVYIPNHLQPQALRHGHCPPTAIHPGVHLTFQNLQGAWYFPNMYRLAREYVVRCHACQQRKGVTGRAPMEGYPLPEAPLTIAWSSPLMSGARFWRHCKCSTFSVAYHLQSNGVVECTKQTVKDALAALARQAPSQWPTHLPAVHLTLNSAIHRDVGDQPLYLLTGRMALFGKGLTNRQTIDPDLSLARLADARRLAVEVSRKMQDRWLGPCCVQQQLGPVSYDVLDLQPPYRAVRIHANQMRPYTPAAEVDFLEDDDRVMCE